MYKLIFTQALSKIDLSFFQNLRHQKKEYKNQNLGIMVFIILKTRNLTIQRICTINKYVI